MQRAGAAQLSRLLPLPLSVSVSVSFPHSKRGRRPVAARFRSRRPRGAARPGHKPDARPCTTPSSPARRAIFNSSCFPPARDNRPRGAGELQGKSWFVLTGCSCMKSQASKRMFFQSPGMTALIASGLKSSDGRIADNAVDRNLQPQPRHRGTRPAMLDNHPAARPGPSSTRSARAQAERLPRLSSRFRGESKRRLSAPLLCVLSAPLLCGFARLLLLNYPVFLPSSLSFPVTFPSF